MHKPLPKHKKAVLKLLLLLIFFLFFMVLALWYYTVHITPILATVGISKSKWLAINAISSAVNERLSDEEFDYDDISILEKNKNGDIIAIKTDIVKLNKIQADLAQAVNNRLNLDEIEITIPIGSIIDNRMLTGWGPKVKFKLIPSGGITTKIENLFTSAGINQTRHQIMLTIVVNASVLLPLSTESATIETSICIAETVLVGKVPETYVTSDEIPQISLTPNTNTQ